MRNMTITFLLGEMRSIWALYVDVPKGNRSDGGSIVLTGDPHTPEEWE